MSGGGAHFIKTTNGEFNVTALSVFRGQGRRNVGLQTRLETQFCNNILKSIIQQLSRP